MIRHLDEGTLQALLDGELSGNELEDAQHHLRTCLVCARTREELRRGAGQLSAALCHLDGAGPGAGEERIEPAPLLAGSRLGMAHDRELGSRELHRGVRPRRAIVSFGRAAAIVLVCAAAASATVPGSPLRGWISSRVGAAPDSFAEPEHTSGAAAAAAVEIHSETGVRVDPAAGAFRVLVGPSATELQIRAALTDAPRGGVFAPSESGIRFRTAPGLIEVTEISGGEVRIEVPRAVRSASVEVDGRVYLVKDGDQLRLAIGAREGSSAEVVFEVGR